MSNAPAFTYDWYKAFLLHAKTQAPLTTFSACDGPPCILLRHDVDLDLLPALRLAEVEAEQLVRATYFIMVSCDFYSPLSSQGRTLLRELTGLGHEVGLHFDPTVYGELDGPDLRRAVDREAQVLSDACGQGVSSVSLHCPSIHGRFPIFEGYANAYAPELFSNDRYVSDSCMNFRGKDPMKWACKGKSQIIQFLFHPLHYSEIEAKYGNILTSKAVRDIEFLDSYYRINPCYADEMSGSTLCQCVARFCRNEE